MMRRSIYVLMICAAAVAMAQAQTPAPAAPSVAALQPDKVFRLSCCCRISELMPLVRQLHDDARAKALARLANDAQQAA